MLVYTCYRANLHIYSPYIVDLYLKAGLDNITEITPSEGYVWHLRAECDDCHNVHYFFLEMTQERMYYVGDPKEAYNLVSTCVFCKKQFKAKFETGSKIISYTMAGEFQRIASFECHGMKFVDFCTRGIWTGKGIKCGTPFNKIDLTSRYWERYDKKAFKYASVYNKESCLKVREEQEQITMSVNSDV
ncbi:hypothetical protein BDF14DRAFT_1850820 [Spinellus fusiger]|nr:hypothetical protein BDF14DRAFT_1850820 [Spinellus fusiger]